VANTVTESPVEGQSDDETSNTLLQMPLVHTDAGITAEPQESPEVEFV
jgi:hypothetical protein